MKNKRARFQKKACPFYVRTFLAGFDASGKPQNTTTPLITALSFFPVSQVSHFPGGKCPTWDSGQKWHLNLLNAILKGVPRCGTLWDTKDAMRLAV